MYLLKKYHSDIIDTWGVFKRKIKEKKIAGWDSGRDRSSCTAAAAAAPALNKCCSINHAHVPCVQLSAVCPLDYLLKLLYLDNV